MERKFKESLGIFPTQINPLKFTICKKANASLQYYQIYPGFPRLLAYAKFKQKTKNWDNPTPRYVRLHAFLQNIFTAGRSSYLCSVYKIKEKRKRGGEAYIHFFGKETISDIFNKVQRYTHEKEPCRRDGKGKARRKKIWERLRKNLMCEGEEEGGRGASEERRMSGEWRAGRTRPVRYAAPRGPPGTPV
jgi:hypothetical protein